MNALTPDTFKSNENPRAEAAMMVIHLDFYFAFGCVVVCFLL